MGQTSANDLNANVGYPTLDGRIADTYAKRSTATNKNSLYDSYLRAFRWATDRIGDSGVVAFVSNGGWVDGNTADGIRLSMAEEYAHIYVYNLRGNARTAGDLRQKEKGNVFGSGARTTVAIFIGIKNPGHTGPCEIHYRDIGDYLSREDKLRIVSEGHLGSVDWQSIIPNNHGDWANQRDDTFTTWPAIGDKKSGPGSPTVFTNFSSGLKTGRDSWCYDYSQSQLNVSIHELLNQYGVAREDFRSHCQAAELTTPKESDVTAFIGINSTMTGTGRISWNSSLKQQLARNDAIEFATTAVRTSAYRPFQKQTSYFSGALNERRYQLPAMFPTQNHKNIGFYVVGTGSDKPFSCLMSKSIPDLSFWGSGSGQFFTRWTYEKSESSDGELDFASTGVNGHEVLPVGGQ
ncbi:hypothetical protein ATN38_04235 [Rhodococcus sp. FH8]|nr:hypothetical protein [Rhodococcus sp. FH8]